MSIREYSKLLLKRTSALGVTPSIPVDDNDLENFLDTDILNGELYINTADKILYTRAEGDIIRLNWLGSTASNYIQDTYETVSNNLSSYPYTLSYSAGKLDQIEYTTTGTYSITKDFFYTGANLTSLVLSGDLPDGLTYLTKNLSYSGANLTSVIYV
jgi:hypothetical protein